MSDNKLLVQAELGVLKKGIDACREEVDRVNVKVDFMNSSIVNVSNEIEILAEEFRDFVFAQVKANRLNQAETKLVKIRQELENKFGHYDLIRRTTTGILQADDLGIVRKSTLATATEELMLSTPGYWLAPALVALAAWINDQEVLANKALKEALKRDDAKTSLLFALICRRANRKTSCVKWTKRFLSNQNERELDRKAIIILDAFASGLLGKDNESIITKQVEEWIHKLEEDDDFLEKQINQWSNAISLKKQPVDISSYTYLRQYSDAWPILEDIMEGADLHAQFFGYLANIFEQESNTESIKEQLDNILDTLVSDFDDEEIPLRIEEKLESLIVDNKGDESLARFKIDSEMSVFDTHKEFTELLTDAAMNPDITNASVSTQKFAIALSKDWILAAYNDLIAQNRVKIPYEIDLNVGGFMAKTSDASNEDEVIESFNDWINIEKMKSLDDCKMGGLGIGALISSVVFLIIFFINILNGNEGSIKFLMFSILLAFFCMYKHGSLIENKKNINNDYEINRKNGIEILRACLAEVVDFREEFDLRDSESEYVVDFLNRISPEQYIKKIPGSNRKVKL